MDYDARKDSLQSEQESEQVEIYFSIKHFSAPAVYLEVYLQETNKPKKKLQQTKPATPYHQVFEFPDPLTI
jgi:hypothetical protein